MKVKNKTYTLKALASEIGVTKRFWHWKCDFCGMSMVSHSESTKGAFINSLLREGTRFVLNGEGDKHGVMCPKCLQERNIYTHE
jgi:hypothetical protein